MFYPYVVYCSKILGLLSLDGDMHHWLHWWCVDLLWTTLGGAMLGGVLGASAGWLVIFLRNRYADPPALNEFLGLGLVCTAYGVATLCLTSEFLAVFTSGLALRRVREHPSPFPAPHASDMRDSVLAFNEQLEKFAELTLVLIVGSMLPYAAPLPATLWFVPLFLVVLRPLSVVASVSGESLSKPQWVLIGWFGIRGVGSIFYLLLAIHHGIPDSLSHTLVSLTLWTVATSIVVHGVTAGPLMRRYVTWRTHKAPP